ncbi:MAG: aminotransferase class III-fold pyridoxal phosphate-dependent enzyme [Rhodospirillales bacterium]
MQYTANSLESHWMPFTSNREFKENPRLIVKGEGVYFTDHKGGTVIDGSSGLFCCPLGHGRKEIAEAVYQQLLENDYASPFMTSTPGGFELAEKVSRILPEPFNHVFFVNSGSEAIDTSLKVVMAYHRARGEGHRTRFVSRERAYHGVNMGGVSLSGMVKNRETFTSVMPNVVAMRHTWSLEETFVRGRPTKGVELADDLHRFCQTYGGSTIAACYVEPVAGSTGCLIPPEGYLERLREICDEHGILLVFDEVITGFGRLGAPFASQLFGVTPDVITMAKAITNGAQPMGAVGVKDDIYNTIVDAAPENAIEFFHGYTYSGHPAACAAGNAVQDIYANEAIFERAAKLAPYFEKKIFELEGMDKILDIRCIGLMAGVELKPKGNPGALGTRCQKELFWNGMHVKFTGDTGIVAPPFVSSEEHIDEMVDKLRATIEAL